jgi:phosphatidylglycerophosphate synthase
MFDAWLRAFKDRLLAPWLARVPWTIPPNAVSLVSFAIGLCAAVAAGRHRYRFAVGLWLVSRAIDGIDGALARVQGTQTDFGGYLDIVLDFVVYALIPIGLVAGLPSPGAHWAALALLASFYVNAASWMYLAAILERRRASGRPRASQSPDVATAVVMPPGLVGGAETIVLYALFLAFPDYLVIGFGLMTVLVIVTIIQRLYWAWRTIGRAP